MKKKPQPEDQDPKEVYRALFDAASSGSVAAIALWMKLNPIAAEDGFAPGPNNGVPAKAKLLSLRQYAKHRGVSHPAVLKAIRTGRITTIDGKIDPDRADAEWDGNTRPKADERRGNGDNPVESYARARAMREVYQGELAQLTLEQKRGVYVRTDEVRASAFSQARKVRDQLIALPDRVAVVLAASQDPGEVHRILEEEIERICQEIADDAERM